MTVGYREGQSFDATRQNWDASGIRPLSWTVWYPAAKGAKAEVPTAASWFRQEAVARDAPIAVSERSHPLVLLSHGSGASASAMAWLAHRLAERGYVALAVDHHGHTGSERYRPEGFLCLWERAADLVALLDDPAWRRALGGVIDDRAHVAGFSAGGYTALQLVGARVAYSQFEPDNPVKSPVRGPREFPDLANQLPRLQANPVFRTSWARRRSDFSDPRFRSAVAIAPGRSVLGFDVESLAAMHRPVFVIGGDADDVAPAAECCNWLLGRIPGSALEIITGGIGHYTFLPEGSKVGTQLSPDLFRDAAGVDRRAVHDEVAGRIANFLDGVR
jgi:predicted dienelactone hydrolase